MTGSEGFDYRTRTNGEVHIFHHGKLARMLKDEPAQDFLASVKDGDAQEVMAAAVGNDGQGGGVRGSAQGPATHLHGNGQAHPHGEFRRRAGS
ncbi:hypothetical protein [Demequina rhizosphaerae]|uniref:hypothetical protein n=1 Tax=Demequina rhizosphaerae TaxID=1638985 RepID=UPI000AFAFADB|nr:hypothetical protein [Demequina rhizosphaerae]